MPSKSVRYRLPERLRAELRRPVGHLLDEPTLISYLKRRNFVVSIGDVVTSTILRYGIVPKIAVIDFKCEREVCNDKTRKLLEGYGEIRIKVRNPASVITEELWNAIKRAYDQCKEKTVCIIVEGEEDLASLVAILFAPPNGTVIYGLPNRGIVLLDVTKKEKDMVKKVLGDRGTE